MPLLVFEFGPLNRDVDHIFGLCDPVRVDAVFRDHRLGCGYLLVLLLLLNGCFIIACVRRRRCFLLLGIAMSGSSGGGVITLPDLLRWLLLRRFRLRAYRILRCDLLRLFLRVLFDWLRRSIRT